jgi:hypothetical protein
VSAAGDAVADFGSDDDLGAAVEAISGGRSSKGRGGGAAGKKPFYNKAYASKYYWRGKAKRGGAGGEAGNRGFSSSSGSRRGGKAVATAVTHRERRARVEEMLDVPMYSNYGEFIHI